MKTKTLLIITLFIMLVFSGCSVSTDTQEQTEQRHLYCTNIDAKVIKIDKQYRYDVVNHWYVMAEVFSEEYDLTEVIIEKSEGGSSNVPESFGYKEGDIVKVRLYSWVIDNTGEVVGREIKGFT